MLPFDQYPGGGKVLLGRISGDNCRRGYGLRFMQITGQGACAYCRAELVSAFDAWLQIAIDHVVPERVCRDLGVPEAWTQDALNKVLACAACNGFGNRYRPAADTECPTTLEAFIDLRDRIFAERKRKILERRVDEQAFYQRRLWEQRL